MRGTYKNYSLLVGYVKEYRKEGIIYKEWQKKGKLVLFGLYNIRNGFNGGLESALHGMDQANIDPGVFQEMNATGGVYMWGSDGYRIVTKKVPSRHQGSVAVFYRNYP